MRSKFYSKLNVRKSTSPGLQANKNVKASRSNLPQRWSRRLRNLPPIPIDVLQTEKKSAKRKAHIVVAKRRPHLQLAVANNTTKVEPGGEFLNLTNLILDRIKNPKQNQIVVKTEPEDRPKNFEILRVIPVIVYIKNHEAKFKAFFDDYELKVKKKDALQLARSSRTSQSQNNVQKQLQQDCYNLEKRWSKRLKMSPNVFEM